jgi:murein DD-endopeptidase MepM/ murein hydrolase activator NlpD
MLKRYGVLIFAVFFVGGLILMTAAAQAQTDDEAPPPTAVPPIDWSQITLPDHAMLDAPANADEPSSSGSEATEPPPNASDTYTIQPGDTLFRIAQRFGLTTHALAAANNIANTNLIYPGQVLAIPTGTPAPQPTAPQPSAPQPQSPPATGTYTVRAGDTLSVIARNFGVDLAVLAAANQIANPSFIRVGQVLTIPGATAVSPPPQPSNPQPVPNNAPPAANTYTVRAGDTLYLIARKFGVSVQTLTAVNNISNSALIYPGQTLIINGEAQETAPANPTPAPDSLFIWPTTSRHIIRYYAYGHQAVDIVVTTGTAVQAMAAGKIEFAGWNYNGYGNLVVVDHGNGWRTLYAHNSQLQVKTGDAVAQGDTIALSGSTGNSTMPHIHLEMMLNLSYINPCTQLPGGC